MAKVLIIYHTTDGHTRKICQRLQQVLEQQYHQVTIVPLNNETHLDLTIFDKIIVGASIRYGNHNPLVYKFINENKLV